MAELADAPDLGSGSSECRFDSCYPHYKKKRSRTSEQEDWDLFFIGIILSPFDWVTDNLMRLSKLLRRMKTKKRTGRINTDITVFSNIDKNAEEMPELFFK